MSRLTPFLLNGLGQHRAGIRLDHRQLARRLAKGQAVQKLPFLPRQRWSRRLLILVDTHKRLEPYWSDFEFIVQQLRQQLGTEAVQAIRFDEAYRGRGFQAVEWLDQAASWFRWQIPAANIPVLVLGDLGAVDHSVGSRAFWVRIARRLQGHDAPVLNLNPMGVSIQEQWLTRQLQPSPLNDELSLPRYPLRNGFDLRQQHHDLEDVLACLSVLPIIDAGLLRRLRQRLNWGGSDVEGLLWNYADMQQTALGIRLRRKAAARHQRIYQEKIAGTATADKLWEEVEEHHKDAYEGLKQLENLNHCVAERQDSAEVRAYFQRLAASVSQSGSDIASKNALMMQARTMLAVLPEQVWQSELSDLAYDVYALVNEEVIRKGDWPELLQAGFDPPKAVQRILEKQEPLETERWQIIQTGSEGEFAFQRVQNMNDLQTTAVTEVDSIRKLPPSLSISASSANQRRVIQEQTSYSLQDDAAVVESFSH